MEVVAEVEEAEVAEVDVGEEEETGKRPDLNLTLRILANTLTRKRGSNYLKKRWSFPGRPGRRIHPRRGKSTHSRV